MVVMVKKKKNRPSKECVVPSGGDTSETADENTSCAAVPGGKCFHAGKAVDVGRVKKSLKSSSLSLQCPDCVLGGIEEQKDSECGLWLCLRCGHQGCGRTEQQHALRHHKVPRSDVHCLVVHTLHWNVWCYICNEEVRTMHKKKIEECIKFLKQQDCPSLLKDSRAQLPQEEGDELAVVPLADVTNTPTALRTPKKKVAISPTKLPRVRGLLNVGNSCFLNSVLQCLAHTPFIFELLEDMRIGGAHFSLPGGQNLIPGDQVELPPLEGHLGKYGPITEALESMLKVLHEDDAEPADPKPLLTKLSVRCPQFGDGDQHDAHELLRHLLEEVRFEDLKRYWVAILGNFGLSRHDTAETVGESVGARVKAYGRQAGEQNLLPDNIFRGFLVSTLECQDCFSSYQRTEPFFELSLPVIVNKPQPPVQRRKNSVEDTYDLRGKSTGDTPSKYQQKKERRQQRKGRKRGLKGSKILDLSPGEPPIAEEVHNSVESQQSDADIEDNLDQDGASRASVSSSQQAAQRSAASEKSVLASRDHACKELRGEQAVNLNFTHQNVAVPMDEDVATCANSRNLPLAGGKGTLLPSQAAERETLSVSISMVVNSLSALGSPSPESSDFNIDSANHTSLGSCQMNDDTDRPFSRIAFCPEGKPVNLDMSSRTVPCNCQEPHSSPTERLNDCVEVDVVHSDILTKEISALSLDRQSPSLWDTCSAHSTEDSKDIKSLDVVLCSGRLPVKEVTIETSKECNTPLVPRYHCEGKACSIESCLNQFTVLELMTGSNKVNCENCSQRMYKGDEEKSVATNSTKQYLVSNPPAVLVLHLKRFEAQENMYRKITRHVSFPLLLDIAPICITKCWELPTVRKGQTKVLYSLYGVVQHFGTLHGGHYSAYIKVRAPVQRDDLRWNFLPTFGSAGRLEEEFKNFSMPSTPLPGKWFHVSDTKVYEVNEDRVRHSQAYMLFYERIW